MKKKFNKKTIKQIKIKKTHTSNIRQDFYKRLLFIGLGIIPIAFVWEQKGWEKYVAIAGFLMVMYNFLLIVILSQIIIDDFFPPKTYKETVTKPFDKFIYYCAMSIFFCALIFQIFVIRTIDNTILGMKLFWQSAFVGLLIATILTLVLKRFNPSIYDKSDRRYSVYFGFFIGFFLLVPAITSFINFTFSDSNENCKIYDLSKKSTGGKRNRSSWIFVKVHEDAYERFDVSREFYNSVEEGGKIQLCTKKGKLGYDFVTDFRTSN